MKSTLMTTASIQCCDAAGWEPVISCFTNLNGLLFGKRPILTYLQKISAS